jgi:AcrR family transcriptional regulator
MRRQDDTAKDQAPLAEDALAEIGKALTDELASDIVGAIDSRDVMRQVRAAGREAVREAREAARATSRESLESVRETMRQVREAEREVARQVREARSGTRSDRARDPQGSRRSGEGDTRSRIQLTALELFTENGYEATSLREIAERLGVTKAALYYHFKTKDEIIESLVHDRIASIDALLAWAIQQPRTRETRREFVRRYSEMLHRQTHHGLMRFFERNQSSMGQHRVGMIMRDKKIQILTVLADHDAPLQDQIRCSLAIFALHSAWFTVRDPDISDELRREAALEVALDLVEGKPHEGDHRPESS